ncbi:hypothetical protein, partial [Rhodococcus pyridinivorans]|uniref:hypothetical protein n=1 Tax=Rhodococcus pyridinivorans TaxID=103816 RepID=UPI0007611652
MDGGDEQQESVWEAGDVVEDVSVGDWVSAALPRFDGTVGSLVPPIYPVYTRVLHPATRLVSVSGEQVPVRWAEVAAATGAVIYPTVEWFSLRYAGVSCGVGDGEGTVWDEEPEVGDMPEGQLAAVATVLAEHTATAGDCWFGFWSGRGAARSMGLPRFGPRLTIPHREDFLLVHGAVRDAVRTLDSWGPNLWWPRDRAWFVASDIDLMSTYIGSSVECARALHACPELEAIGTTATTSVTWDSDQVD